MRTGRNMDGIEMDERMASNSFPLLKTTYSPVYRSVATAKSNPLDQTLRFTLTFDMDGLKDLFKK